MIDLYETYEELRNPPYSFEWDEMEDEWNLYINYENRSDLIPEKLLKERNMNTLICSFKWTEFSVNKCLDKGSKDLLDYYEYKGLPCELWIVENPWAVEICDEYGFNISLFYHALNDAEQTQKYNNPYISLPLLSNNVHPKLQDKYNSYLKSIYKER